MPVERATFTAPSVRSLRQHVIEELRSAILQGRIQPGDRIVEADLAQQFAVSRGCVREALRGLEKEGLVVSSPYRETRVASTTEEEVVEVLLPIRVVIETYVARQLTGRLESRQVAALEQIIEAMRSAAAAGDKRRLTELDIDFHRRLLTFVDKPAIQAMWTGIDTRVRGKFLLDTLASDPEDVVRLHENLLAELRSGQQDTIGAALVRHIYGALPSRVMQNGVPPAIRTLAEVLGVGDPIRLIVAPGADGKAAQPRRGVAAPATPMDERPIPSADADNR